MRDFDTFGKMDPFLTLCLDKDEQKTETAHDAGKECFWKNTFTFKYYDNNNIIVKSYDEDVTNNDFMGEGSIQTKTFKAKG